MSAANDNISNDRLAPAAHRRRGLRLGLAVPLLAIGVLALCEWQGWSFLKRPIERKLAQRLERQVSLGEDFKLRVFGSLRVQTDQLRVGAPQWQHPSSGEAAPDMVRATNAYLKVPYGTLVGLMRDNPPPPRITALRFGSLDASLERDASGRATWSMPTKPEEQGKPKAATMAAPQIDELVIEAGRLSLNDALTKLKMETTIRTVEGEQAAQAKGLAIEGRGSYQDQDFDFNVRSSGLLPIVAPPETTAGVPVSVHARVGRTQAQFTGQGTDLLHLRGLDGDVSVTSTSLAEVGDMVGVTVPTTPPFSLKGHLAKQGALWSLKLASLNTGTSRLAGNFTFDQRPEVPMLSGELTGTRLVLADLAPAFGASSTGGPTPVAAPGRVLPDKEFDIPSLRAMNANVKLRFQHADLGSLFAEPLQPLEGDIGLNAGVLRISNIQARAAGGELHGDVSLDPKVSPASWNVDLRWSGIKLDRWLRPRNDRTKDETVAANNGKAPGYVTGQLRGQAQLRGQGNSTAKLLGSLNGTVQAWVQGGEISHLVVEAIGLDVAKVLGLMVTGDKPLPMNCAVAHFTAAKGKIVPETAVIDTSASTILASGSMSLTSEQLDLTLTAQPKDATLLSLRTPLHVQGTFSDPHVRLDANPLGLKVLAAAALAAVNPLAGLIPLVETGDTDNDGCLQTVQRLRGDGAPGGHNPASAHAPGAATQP